MVKKEIVFDGVTYDTMEEYYFSCWLSCLKAEGYIIDFKRDCESFNLTTGLSNDFTETIKLKTKTKQLFKSQRLLQPSVYTPDFYIHWANKGEGLFWQYLNVAKISTPFIAQKNGKIIYSWVENKPEGWDYNNMTRLFTLNQKFTYEKFKEYVNLIYTTELFRESFTPDEYLLTPTGRTKKLKYKPLTLKELLYD